MSDRAIKGSLLPAWANNVSGNDVVILITRSQLVPNTYVCNVSVFFSNTNFGINLGSNQTFSANTVIVRGSNTPANSTALTVPQGTVFWDSSYFYVATANNVVKRAALSTF